MREQIKSDLLSAINRTEDDGTYSDETYEAIQDLMDKLAAESPTPSPFDKQDFITDHWATLYAQFGPRHTCLLYTSPSPRDQRGSRMPSSA